MKNSTWQLQTACGGYSMEHNQDIDLKFINFK